MTRSGPGAGQCRYKPLGRIRIPLAARATSNSGPSDCFLYRERPLGHCGISPGYTRHFLRHPRMIHGSMEATSVITSPIWPGVPGWDGATFHTGPEWCSAESKNCARNWMSLPIPGREPPHPDLHPLPRTTPIWPWSTRVRQVHGDVWDCTSTRPNQFFVKCWTAAMRGTRNYAGLLCWTGYLWSAKTVNPAISTWNP